MKKKYQFIFLIFSISILFTSCITTSTYIPHYRVKIDSLKASTFNNELKKCIIFPGNKNTKINDLQYQEFLSYLSRALLEKGYSITEDFNQAQIAIFFGYGIGDPQQNSYSYSLPEWGQTGISSKSTYGSAYSYGNSLSFNSTTSYTPKYGIKGYTRHSGTYTTYFRYLLLTAYDLNEYRKTKQEKQIWKTTVTSSGRSGDLRQVFPVLVAASKQYIGENTGQKINVNISENDEKILKIKGIDPTKTTKKK
jgi:hypothetical protein